MFVCSRPSPTDTRRSVGDYSSIAAHGRCSSINQFLAFRKARDHTTAPLDERAGGNEVEKSVADHLAWIAY